MTIRQCLLWSFQMFFPISVRDRTSVPIAFQCLSSFHLNSSMVLLCTNSCGILFQSRGAFIVKNFFRISRFVPVGHIWRFDLERSEKHLILEGGLIFREFEWSLSCTIFSRWLKVKGENSEQSSDNRGKVARKISGKLLFAISVAIII